LFRRKVRYAKESLSRNQTWDVELPTSEERALRVTREQFEDTIRDEIDTSVDILERTIRHGAKLSSVEQLAAIYLAGGSSRIPLARAPTVERLALEPMTLDEPKAVIALGAALAESAGKPLVPRSVPTVDRAEAQPPPAATESQPAEGALDLEDEDWPWEVY